MVAIFVIFTILLSVGIELMRDRAAQRKASLSTARAPADRFLIPKGYFMSKAHTWVEVMFSGKARIGIDDFAQKVIGTIERIEVAPLGAELKKGEPLLTIRHGSRFLSIPAPITGTILTVNESVLASPEMLRRDPYIAGWIATMAPNDISAELPLLSIAEDAARWLRKEISRFRDFLKAQSHIGIPTPAGATLLDGGMPLSGVLEQFNENTWNAFQQEFLKAE